ncbi:hypothetical protein OCU04_012247 [Sclerotinia nivalis]|uniref:Uncharacterized protein n=1 Tax=Sclerotinia nivalis TaxID=352851 RepID=A0A9X0DF33_9HELO|nr:hypothetical protein OCU04_012247 [Sclerotinia nivalis]
MSMQNQNQKSVDFLPDLSYRPTPGIGNYPRTRRLDGLTPDLDIKSSRGRKEEVSGKRNPIPRKAISNSTSQAHAIRKPQPLISNQHFRFYSLPTEIRELIYGYVLLKPHVSDNGYGYGKPVFLQAVEMYGSADLFNEAKRAFYSINNFTSGVERPKKGWYDAFNAEIFGFSEALPLRVSPSTPLSAQLPLVYSTLRHLRLRSNSCTGIHRFIERLLPNFKALRTLRVEITRDKKMQEGNRSMWASESWRYVLDNIITSDNGDCVKGVMVAERIVSDKNPDNAKGPAWVWRVGMADKYEDVKLKLDREVCGGKMEKGMILRFKENDTLVKF